VRKGRPKDEIVELLEGLGAILMAIDAHVETIIEQLGGVDGQEEEDDS
jgi:hypothetical protein